MIRCSDKANITHSASQQLVEADATAHHELAEMQVRLQQQFEANRRNIDGHLDKVVRISKLLLINTRPGTEPTK